MIGRQHAARQIPISRPVHRNGRRAAASLARFADEVATLHLINAIVVGVPIVAVLGAAVPVCECRAPAHERASRKQESRNRNGANPLAAMRTPRLTPGLTILSVLHHLAFLTRHAKPHGPYRPSAAFIPRQTCCWRWLGCEALWRFAIKRRACPDIGASLVPASAVDGVLVMVMARMIGRVWRIRSRCKPMQRVKPARQIPITGPIHRDRGRAAAGLPRIRRRGRRAAPGRCRCGRHSNRFDARCRRRRRRKSPRRGLSSPSEASAQEQRGNHGRAPQAARFRSRLLRSPHGMLLNFAHAHIWGRKKPIANHIIRRNRYDSSMPGSDFRARQGEYTPMTSHPSWPLFRGDGRVRHHAARHGPETRRVHRHGRRRRRTPRACSRCGRRAAPGKCRRDPHCNHGCARRRR